VKEIGTDRSMFIKHSRGRAIVGHSHPIVSIYFPKNVMTNMMVLRKVYVLVVDLLM